MQKRFKAFTTLITNINRYIKRIKTEEMQQFDLKSVHVSCVYYLYKEGSLTIKELCEVCDEDKANISRAVEYLEDRGYIIKRTKGSKRYKSPIELSDDGKNMGSIIADKIHNIFLEVTSDIPEEDREAMYRSLEVISENLRKYCDGYDKICDKMSD